MRKNCEHSPWKGQPPRGLWNRGGTVVDAQLVQERDNSWLLVDLLAMAVLDCVLLCPWTRGTIRDT